MFVKLLLHIFTFLISFVMVFPITANETEENPLLNQDVKPEIKILDYLNEQTVTGHHTHLRLSDGQWRNDTIEIVNKGTENEEVIHKGIYEFIDANGYVTRITYNSDKNGCNANMERIPPIVVEISQTLLITLTG